MSIPKFPADKLNLSDAWSRGCPITSLTKGIGAKESGAKYCEC